MKDTRRAGWLALISVSVASGVALASALTRVFDPARLSMGAAVVATGFAIVLSRRMRQARRDVESVVRTLESIGQGNFASVTAPLVLPGGLEIGTAVNSMAEQLRREVDGLREVARRDPLTGLFNRSHFERIVQHLLDRGHPAERHCVLFIDIDGFKLVNDTLGHNHGDRLLQLAADRLRLAARADDMAAEVVGSGSRPVLHISRFGGDEFVMFVGRTASPAMARRLASRTLRVLAEPFELGPHSARISASIGIAFYPGDGMTCADLLRAADTAMYHAKRSGRNRCEIYNPALDEDARRIADQESELRDAVALGQFELHYQPLYDVRTEAITSVEALIRWRHPHRGLLLPADFIPLAERANLIDRIGEWAVDDAVCRIAEFTQAGRPLQISVNISPQHLEQPEFVAHVADCLRRWNAPAHLLELDITEELAMRDPDLAAERLRQITALGVSIAIDDFGTGYSNLPSLIMLPLTRLKVDRSLVKNLTTRPEARVLVQTIVGMAGSLGFQSVAEGVETREQMDLLLAMGCDAAQGYLLSRPVDMAQLRVLLAIDAVPPARSLRMGTG